MRLGAFHVWRCGAPAGELLKEGGIVMTETQPRARGRQVTPNLFEPAALSRESLETASQLDLGCVDWYLYPITRSAGPTGGSHGAPRGNVAKLSGDNRSG